MGIALASSMLAMCLSACARHAAGAAGSSSKETLACPSPQATPTSSPGILSSGAGDGPLFNFDEPWNAEPVSFEDAAGAVDFAVHEPQSLGDPAGVFVEPNKDAIALAYVADCGRVVLIESLPDMPPENWEPSARAVVAEHEPGSPGEFEIVPLGNTDSLVAIAADNRSVSVEWLQEGLEFTLAAPEAVENQAVDLARIVHGDVATDAAT